MTNPDDTVNLTDPVVVHANMLRGTIAKPTVEQIIHIYGADTLRAALPAVAASQNADPVNNADIRQRVTVKPLVWKNGAGREQVACTIVGTYVVDKHGWARTSDRNMTQAENPKAAAQADYEARILAAIDVQPDPRDAQIAALVEALTDTAAILQALMVAGKVRSADQYRIGGVYLQNVSDTLDAADAAIAAAKGGDA